MWGGHLAVKLTPKVITFKQKTRHTYLDMPNEDKGDASNPKEMIIPSERPVQKHQYVN